MLYGDMIHVDWYIIRGIACMLSILTCHYIGYCLTVVGYINFQQRL